MPRDGPIVETVADRRWIFGTVGLLLLTEGLLLAAGLPWLG